MAARLGKTGLQDKKVEKQIKSELLEQTLVVSEDMEVQDMVFLLC